jgi:hypothetical protein
LSVLCMSSRIELLAVPAIGFVRSTARHAFQDLSGAIAMAVSQLCTFCIPLCFVAGIRFVTNLLAPVALVRSFAWLVYPSIRGFASYMEVLCL